MTMPSESYLLFEYDQPVEWCYFILNSQRQITQYRLEPYIPNPAIRIDDMAQEQAHYILEQLSNGHLIIQEAADLNQVLRCLRDTDDQKKLIAVLGEKLEDIVQNSHDLGLILVYEERSGDTNPRDVECQFAILHALRRRLKEILWFDNDDALVWWVETTLSSKELTEKIGHYLLDASDKDINQLQWFWMLLIDTAADYQTVLIERVGKDLMVFFKDHNDLILILKELNFEPQSKLIETLGEDLKPLFKDYESLCHVLEVLLDDLKIILMQKLGTHLKTLIQTNRQLKTMSQYLDKAEHLPRTRAMVIYNLGFRVVKLAKNDSVFKMKLKKILEEDRDSLPREAPDLYYIHNKILCYILKTPMKKAMKAPYFFSLSIPQKIGSAHWLLGLLTHEIKFVEARFQRCLTALKQSELRDIVLSPVIQAYTVQSSVSNADLDVSVTSVLKF